MNIKTTTAPIFRLSTKMSLNLVVFIMLALTTFICSFTAVAKTEVGIDKNAIRIGGVMDLEGRSRGLGQGMKLGITAAIKGHKIQGRTIEYITLDDSYSPDKTITSTNEIVDKGVFLVMGNVGTPTAKVSLPILAKHNVPAVGFFTGAGLLRPGKGEIINYRASYVQETAAVIQSAIKAGVDPSGICAYVQNDAYGMAGVEGIKRALSTKPGTGKVIKVLKQVMALEGNNPERNNVGPVGVYTRNTFTSKSGYDSLKNWEEKTGSRCRLVVSVGTYNAIARFGGYARYKGEDWIISAVSFTGADNFKSVLDEFHIHDKIIMTQVVPPLNSKLPIVKQARDDLGDDFGYVSLEGYIVGKMWLNIMNNIKGDITRENFLAAVQGRRFRLGGLTLDFTNDNQGSDLVVLNYLDGDQYHSLTKDVWRKILN